MVLRGRNPSRRPSAAAPGAPAGLPEEVAPASVATGSAKEAAAPTPAPQATSKPPSASSTKAAPAAKSGKKASAAEAGGSGTGAAGGSGGSGPGGSGKKSQTPEFLVKLHRILLNEDTTIIHWDNGAFWACLMSDRGPRKMDWGAGRGYEYAPCVRGGVGLHMSPPKNTGRLN